MNLESGEEKHYLSLRFGPDFCFLHPVSLRLGSHDPERISQVSFEFINEIVETKNSTELKNSAATVIHEHSKRNVFDLGFGLELCHLNLFLASPHH
jgi:hypothetical protein